MAKPVSIKQKRSEAPDWVFPWRPVGERKVPKWFALLLVGGFFAFFLTSVRIRVSPPAPWAARKASVIHVADSEEGRLLALRAREGGPFPTRLDPAQWAGLAGLAALEKSALDSSRWSPPAYEPTLRDLPEDVTPPIRLAAGGEAFLPRRTAPKAPAIPAGNLKPAPVLRPLSGITASAMPGTLPPYDQALDDRLTAKQSRFLLRLDETGRVTECIPLEGGDPSPLEGWLRRVSFAPEPAKPTRWISVGVGFANQAADGSEPR
jgi:hypothetical protein